MRHALLALCLLAGPAAAAPSAPPTPAELDAEIALVTTELSRAGSSALAERLERLLADLWVLRARAHVDAGANDLAKDAYEKALSYSAAHRYATTELGWLELRTGRPDRARALAETGLAAHAGDPDLLRLRGEVLYLEGRISAALEDLVAAAEKRPADEPLAAKIAKLRREQIAEREHGRALSGHFTVSYDGARDEAAGELLLEVLERAWDDLAGELSVYRAAPVPVVLYTREQFADATGAGENVLGLFDGKIRLPAGGVARATPALERLARHELVHALLEAKAPRALPRWLHEGLAQLLEPRDVAAADRLAAAAGGRLEPFTYPAALSFVAFLEQHGSRERLLWLVELLGSRTAEDDALREAFGESRVGLLERWRASFPAAERDRSSVTE
ncbi:MAG: tetratricopeptide repeat protein [Acidobacteria bacterium]|nr:tetratricopeptide repeat protein [Acidobacteriota bacterium]